MYYIYSVCCKPLQEVNVILSMEPAHVVSCGTVWPVDLTVEWNRNTTQCTSPIPTSSERFKLS